MGHHDEKAPDRADMHAGAPPGEDTRRDFLKVVGIGGIGLGLGAVTAGPAIAYVAYPLTNETVSGSRDFIKIGKSEQFKPGAPVKVDVFADKKDAWNRVISVKIGSAWLMREGAELRAYSTVCPHLGCAVDFDGDDTKFKCPCHHSAFTLAGKVEGGPSPRGMDQLEVKEQDGAVAVRYQRFRQGIAEKEVI
jgi:Rieske Fe-S protein